MAYCFLASILASLLLGVFSAPNFHKVHILNNSNGVQDYIDSDSFETEILNDSSVPPNNHHQTTITAKFWYVADLDGDPEKMVDDYVAEMNMALEKSKVYMKYMKWGSVQKLPLKNDFYEDRDFDEGHRKFLTAFGNTDKDAQILKQSADHIVLISNKPGGSCSIFGPNYSKMNLTQKYATVLTSASNPQLFVHEAGHCLGAMHDRYTHDNLNSSGYNYGYCLPDIPYATVMAYPWKCPQQGKRKRWISQFSNPEVSYEGVPTGDKRNNNARALNEQREDRKDLGNNCYNGSPDENGYMKNECKFEVLNEWGPWSECCCPYSYNSCGTSKISSESIEVSRGKRVRVQLRACKNLLGETLPDTLACEEQEDFEGDEYISKGATLWEVGSCLCEDLPW